VKILCPACERLSDIGAFRMDGPALVLQCARCGVESRLVPQAVSDSLSTAAAAGAQALPSEPGGSPGASPGGSPGGSNVVPLRPAQAPVVAQPAPSPLPSSEDTWVEVPKGHCPKCVAPRREGATACAQCGLVFANFKPAEHRPSPWLLTAWRELSAHWEEPEAHQRFVKDAALQQELVAAGRLYRIRLARFPDDAMAAHGRDALLQLASSPTQLSQGEDALARRRSTSIRAIVTVLLVAVGMGVLLAVLRRMLIGVP